MNVNINPYRTARLKYNMPEDRAAEILQIPQQDLKRMEAYGTPPDEIAIRMSTLYRAPQLMSEHAERISDKNFRPLTPAGHTATSVSIAMMEFFYATNIFKTECAPLPKTAAILEAIDGVNVKWTDATFGKERA